MTAFVASRKDWNKSRGPDVRPTSMGNLAEPTSLRRAAGALTLGGAALGLVYAGATESDFLDLARALLAMGALTGAASVMLLRRTVLAQVMARGFSWLLFLPAASGVLEELLRGRIPDVRPTAFMATVGASLLLARPNLFSAEARREFAPVGYRRLFLAGAIASVTAGLATGAAFVGSLLGRGHEELWLGALSGVMLATALGVVRMRAWGVLLGIVTSSAMMVGALLHLNDFTGTGYVLGALPGLLLAAPLLLARLRPERHTTAPTAQGFASTRVSAPGAALASPTVRVRVSDLPVEEAADVGEPEHLSARAP
jgi:hypothetical protein